MTPETYGISPDSERAVRVLSQYLYELDAQLRLLPLNSRLRGPLITRIRDVEDQLGSVRGL